MIDEKGNKPLSKPIMTQFSAGSDTNHVLLDISK